METRSIIILAKYGLITISSYSGQVKDKASVSVVACEQGKGRGTLKLEHEDGHLGF